MSMKIIDVSEHNGKIDWSKVQYVVDAVIIRAGYGKGNKDKQFENNIKGAIAAGLDIGIYWFSYAYTNDMAKKEACYCNELIAPYKEHINYPVFFDWEYDSMHYAKNKGFNLNAIDITEMNVAFCRKIDDLGYKAGYYLNADYQKNFIDTKSLKGYYKWFAYYKDNLDGHECDIWQFTSTGRVSGITGNVDLDVSDKNIALDGAGSVEDELISGDMEEYDMPEIKYGSKGKAVAVWQIIVSAYPDGEFGTETKKATEIFQEEHGLVVDGIVGPKSWKAGLDSVDVLS